MKNKAMIFFAFTALLMFSQYAFPNSFADNNTATAYSVSYLNATSTPSITPVTYQSSSDTSSSSSTVQAVATQTIANQSVPVQTVPVYSVSTQSANTQSSTVQAVATQTVPVQSVSTQPSTVQAVANQSIPAQPVPIQAVNTTRISETIPQHSTQTTSSSRMSNYTSSPQSNTYNHVSNTYNHVSSPNPSPLQTISGQWANNRMSDSTFIQNAQHYINLGNYIPGIPIPQWIKNNAMLLYKGQIDQKTFESGIQDWLSTYHSATYQTRGQNYKPQYQQYISSNTLQSTSTAVTPNSATSYYGDPVTFTVTVTDPLASQNAITGTVSWSDGGIGGTFSSTSCTLNSASCTVSYTPPVNSPSGVTITANYGGDSTHQSSSGSSYLTVNVVHNTTTTIAPNSATYSNEPVTFTVTVTDPLTSSNAITGIVSWSDGGIGGTFSSADCTLYSASCTVSYTPPVNSPSTVTITANYQGDSVHRSSSDSSYLAVNLVHSTTTTITPNPATYSNGPVTLTAIVTDPLASPNNITGTLSWSDNGAGGTFSQIYCYTPDNCTTTYTPNVAYSGTVTISANYGGDNIHSASSGTTTLASASSLTLASYTTTNIQTDKTSYDPGNTVTITASPDGAQAGQNVAILVTDPSSNIVASRTVQVDTQGNSKLQIGLSPDAQAGTYQITASALVNGNYLSYHAVFTVTSNISQPLSISIISAQPTDQMGDKTVTSFSKGTTGYAKVALSSNSTQTALVTVNLVGSDGTSLGVGSVKTTLGTGSSEMEVSFYIPNNASVGTGNIYVDTYSDWPSKGGVPLTGETSATVSVG